MPAEKAPEGGPALSGGEIPAGQRICPAEQFFLQLLAVQGLPGRSLQRCGGFQTAAAPGIAGPKGPEGRLDLLPQGARAAAS